MKKILLSSFLACSLFAAGEVYSPSVKDVYVDATSQKSIGRLLPTNAVKILANEGDRVKISVKGYQNPAVSNVGILATPSASSPWRLLKPRSPRSRS